MFNIEEKKELLSNTSVRDFLDFYYLSENLYKMKRVIYDKEVNKKTVKYDDLKLHMTAIKSVSDHYKWSLSEDELSLIFASKTILDGKETTLTLKRLRNNIVHECNITSMKNIIENFDKIYRPLLDKFIGLFM